MNYWEITDAFAQVANELKEDMAVAVSYLVGENLDARMQAHNVNVDSRDFAPMVALMGVEGETREERNADIIKKIELLSAAFTNPDHTQRYPYLNMMYDFVDSFDPTTVDMHSTKDVKRLLQCYLLSQTVSMKRDENPEYFAEKYSTEKQLALWDANDQYLTTVGSELKAHLVKLGINIDIKLTLPQPVSLQARPTHRCVQAYKKAQLENIKNDVPTSDVVEVPIVGRLVNFLGKNVSDVTKYSATSTAAATQYTTLMVETNLLLSTGENMKGLSAAHLDYLNAVYVDGKPIRDFIKEQIPKHEGTLGEVCAKVIVTAMLNGNPRVDVVNTYQDKNGDVRYEAKNLRAPITPELEQQYMKSFSWIRRTLFNWGPFRIPPLEEKMALLANDPDIKTRHTMICNDLKSKVDPAIAEQREKDIREKREQERREKVRALKDEETKRLDESVDQWDKESVIGMLGQQVKGSYKQIMDALTTKYEKRYPTASVPLAKQVLYTQLYMERKENGGQMGPFEESLMGQTKEETEANIQREVEKRAKDPALKSVFLARTGIKVESSSELIPTTSLMQEVIAYGGCQRLTLEYMAKLEQIKGKNVQIDAAQTEKTVQKDENVKISVIS